MQRLMMLALLGLWANSALARDGDGDFCDLYSEPEIAEQECRIDLSAPAPPVPDPAGPVPATKFRELRNPPAAVVVDVCTAWSRSTEPTITLAEIEYGRADGLPGATVLVLSATRAAGQDVLMVDWISAANDNWTLAGTTNTLPPSPVDVMKLEACNTTAAGKFSGPRLTVRLDQKRVVISQSPSAMRSLPLKNRLPGDPVLAPRSLRVALFRNAGFGSGVVATRWSQPDGGPATAR